MRQTLRYIISGIILIGIIVGVYFLFFAPKQDLSIYEQSMIVLDYKQKLNSIDTMQSLNDANGYGENYSHFFDATKHAEIISVRKKLFGETNGKITLTELNGSSYSGYIYCYMSYDKVLEDYIKLYSTYLKNSSGADKSSQDELLELMNDYKDNYIQLNTMIATMKNVQANYMVAEGQSDNALYNADLTNHYRNLQVLYRKSIKSQADLLIALRNYAIKYTFTNNFTDSGYTSIHDCMAFSISSAFNITYESENGYLVDATSVIDNCISFENGNLSSVFTSLITKQDFINAYRNVYYNYYEGLLQIFSLSHEIKNEVVNNNSFVNANIVVEYQSSVKSILTILCF